MMSDEQVREFHEKYGPILRDNSYIDDAINAHKERYAKAIGLIRGICNYLSNPYDAEDVVRCPHCEEPIL